MSKRNIIVLTLVLLLLVVGGYFVYSYFTPTQQQDLQAGNPIVISQSKNPAVQQLLKAEQISYSIETVAENLYVPWSIVFTSNDRFLVSERNGAIKEVVSGELNSEPLAQLPVVENGEVGLMGLVADPGYETNKTLYACYGYQEGASIFTKVVTLIDRGSSLTEQRTVIDAIPAARFHAGCELAFGPDGKLYITTGDAIDGAIAQDPNSLGGKILRINSDGTIPEDNPTANSAVYSLGHRNPQGIAWHSSGLLYSTEHGPSSFDGPPGGDELNLIKAGENYGWPEVSHEESLPEFTDPKITFTPAVAPGSALFYTSQVIPEFQDNLFFAMLKGEGITRVVLDPENPENILWYEKLPNINVGRVRELTEGPDGFIYFATSNQDGRGAVNPGDDKIYRLVPVN